MAAVRFQDDDIIAQLRTLKAQRDSGQLSAKQYARAFDRLNRAVGVPCSRCGTVPAVITQADGRVLCGRCEQQPTHPLSVRIAPVLAFLLIAAVLLALAAVAYGGGAAVGWLIDLVR